MGVRENLPTSALFIQVDLSDAGATADGGGTFYAHLVWHRHAVRPVSSQRALNSAPRRRSRDRWGRRGWWRGRRCESVGYTRRATDAYWGLHGGYEDPNTEPQGLGDSTIRLFVY